MYNLIVVQKLSYENESLKQIYKCQKFKNLKLILNDISITIVFDSGYIYYDMRYAIGCLAVVKKLYVLV